MDEKNSLFKNIREIVAKIPSGKVATYGQIAKLVGTKDARKVGWAVYGNQNPDVPCHRVVFSNGGLAEKYSLGGWEEQKERLLREGVEFSDEKTVDMKKHLWKG